MMKDLLDALDNYTLATMKKHVNLNGFYTNNTSVAKSFFYLILAYFTIEPN